MLCRRRAWPQLPTCWNHDSDVVEDESSTADEAAALIQDPEEQALPERCRHALGMDDIGLYEQDAPDD